MATIFCPACSTNLVPAVGWKFADTKVSVPVCEACRVGGLTAITLKVTAMADLEVPQVTVRHRTGLIEMVGAGL